MASDLSMFGLTHIYNKHYIVRFRSRLCRKVHRLHAWLPLSNVNLQPDYQKFTGRRLNSNSYSKLFENCSYSYLKMSFEDAAKMFALLLASHLELCSPSVTGTSPSILVSLPCRKVYRLSYAFNNTVVH